VLIVSHDLNNAFVGQKTELCIPFSDGAFLPIMWVISPIASGEMAKMSVFFYFEKKQ
jgi:formate-dependent nitrite reductase membrane component NrfD